MKHRFKALFAALCLLLLPLTAQAGQPWHEGYFPNAELTDQDGKKLKFYDDVIKGKVVALNFIYTKCRDVCPADTAQLTRVRDMLGDRVGKDVFMYSISLDPAHDTPKVLKAYMHMFGVKSGWTFLTGKKSDIELLQRRLGLIGKKAPELKDHDTSFIIGNEATGQWIKRSAYDDPKVLAILLGETLPNKPGSEGREPYSAAKQIDSHSSGDFLFRTRCSSCHTIGGGERLGPDLAGVATNRPRAWLTRWLKEPDKMIDEKDPVALELKARYRNMPMPNLGLNDVDANDLIEYLTEQDKAVASRESAKSPAAKKP